MDEMNQVMRRLGELLVFFVKYLQIGNLPMLGNIGCLAAMLANQATHLRIQ